MYNRKTLLVNIIHLNFCFLFSFPYLFILHLLVWILLFCFPCVVYSLLIFLVLFYHLLFLSLHLSWPDWWCAEVRQTGGGWEMAPASLWHWARIQAVEMIDAKSNFKQPRFKTSRQMECWAPRLATQLGQPDKTCGSGVILPLCRCVRLCVWVCWPSWLKQLTLHSGHLLKGSLRTSLWRPPQWFLRA